MAYYLVTDKCGHVKRHSYVPINFAVIANSKKEASDLVRSFPRVKRDHKDCILNNIEVSEEEYQETLLINNSDPYLQAKCVQDQNRIPNFQSRIVKDTKRIERESKVLTTKRNNVYKRRRLQDLADFETSKSIHDFYYDLDINNTSYEEFEQTIDN